MIHIIAHISAQENIPEQLQPLNIALLDGIKETASFLDIQPLHDHVKDAITEKISPTANTLLNSQSRFLTDPQFLEDQYLNIDTLGTLSFDIGTQIIKMVPNLKTWILHSMCPHLEVEDDVFSCYTHQKHPIIFPTLYDIIIEPSDVMHNVNTYLKHLITIEDALLLSCIYDAHQKNIPLNFAQHPWLSIHFKKLNENLKNLLLEKGAVLLLPESPPNQETNTQGNIAIVQNRSDGNRYIRSSHIYLILPLVGSAIAASSYLMYQKLKKKNN